MLATRKETLERLRCPKTGERLTRVAKDKVAAAAGRCEYPVLNDVPVVIDFENSVLDEVETRARAAESMVVRADYANPALRFVKGLLSPEKKATQRNVSRLIDDLEAKAAATGREVSALIVGGGSVGQGMAPLYDHPSIKVFSFDIYASDLVQFVGDAHHIPAADGAFDAVVVQAVLEHVLAPDRAASEIWRVLKDDGLVYAETPFMQQVHEGPYDFTRFTESGHRYLFRWFERLGSGTTGGPGLQLMWSTDYFFRSVFRSRMAGKIAKLAVFWTQYLDRLAPERYAVDGACGVFFYGRKSDRAISPREAVAHYRGAQR
ncbi:MAG: class I SAM-dependent methyltransferase [Parvularculaceae bacterium]